MKIAIQKDKINIFEVGAADYFASKTKNYWGNDKFQINLIEPNPFLYKSLLSKTKDIKNIKTHNIAISNETKMTKLVCAGVLSYLPDIISPINTIFLGKLNEILSNFTIPVNSVTFDFFDKGDIDYLILGMEGAEFTVFQYLVSRPMIIVLHNYFANDYGYSFPNFNFISKWCNENEYEIIGGIPDITLINKRSIKNGLLKINQ